MHDGVYLIEFFLLKCSFQKQPAQLFCKKGVLRISDNSQENTCARDSFLINLQARSATLFKKLSGADVSL